MPTNVPPPTFRASVIHHVSPDIWHDHHASRIQRHIVPLPMVDQPRPSSAPLFMACPMSHKLATTVIRTTDNGAAHLGRAVHTVIDRHFRHGHGLAESLQHAADVGVWYGAHQVDPDDCTFLVRQFFRIWPETRGMYQYRPEPGQLLDVDGEQGTPDVYAVSDTQITVGDFKTGWNIDDHYHQIMYYLWLLSKHYPGRSVYMGYVYHLRHEKTVKYLKSQQALDQWRGEFAGKRNSNSYNIGGHCSYCRHVLNCSAARSSIEFFTDQRTAGQPVANIAQTLPIAMELIKTAKNAIGAAENAKAAMVRASGGLLDLGNGTAYRETIQWRKVFNLSKAWPVLCSIFGETEVAKLFKLTTTALKTALRQRYPGEPVSQTLRAVMERLAEADAVMEMPVTVIRSDNEPQTPEEE